MPATSADTDPGMNNQTTSARERLVLASALGLGPSDSSRVQVSQHPCGSFIIHADGTEARIVAHSAAELAGVCGG